MYRRSLHKDWRQPGVKRRIASLNQPQWQTTPQGTQLANQQFAAPAVLGTPQFANQQFVAPQFAIQQSGVPQFATQQPMVVLPPAMATQSHPSGTHTAQRPQFMTPQLVPQQSAPIVTLMPPVPTQPDNTFRQPVQLGAPLTQVAPAATEQRMAGLPVVDPL